MTDIIDNVLRFRPRLKQTPAPQFELRLDRETFDLEVGVITVDGDVVPLCTYGLVSKPDDAALAAFVSAWNTACGEPPGIAS